MVRQHAFYKIDKKNFVHNDKLFCINLNHQLRDEEILELIESKVNNCITNTVDYIYEHSDKWCNKCKFIINNGTENGNTNPLFLDFISINHGYGHAYWKSQEFSLIDRIGLPSDIFLDKSRIREITKNDVLKTKNEYVFNNLSEETPKILIELEKWFDKDCFVFLHRELN